MKKSYPKEKYCALFIFSILFFFSTMYPVFFRFDEGVSALIGWICFFGGFSVIFFIIGLYHVQFHKIVGDKLILKNVFGKLEEISLNNAVYEIKDMSAKCFAYGEVKKKWICIYEKNENIEKFEKGCSNRKGMHRIQIIYSKEFLSELEKRKVEKMVE